MAVELDIQDSSTPTSVITNNSNTKATFINGGIMLIPKFEAS